MPTKPHTPHPTKRPPLGWLLLMLAVLLMAAAVRFHGLDAQSLWYDEGVAYGHSLRTLPQIVEAVSNNVHVPAYFTLLALWQDLTGSSEFALRALSVLMSLLSVALAYALGKRLFSPLAGLSAALLVALNTFSIYYAQETRMYAMLAAIATGSMWLFVGWVLALHQAQPRSSLIRQTLLLGTLNALGLYTHYSYGLVILAQGLLLAFAWGSQLYQRLRHTSDTSGPLLRLPAHGLLAYGLTLLLFAPWLPIALRELGAQSNIAEPLPLDLLLRQLQGWFTFGLTFEYNMGAMGAAVYFLLLFGLLVLPRHRAPLAGWRMLVPVVWVVLSGALYVMADLNARYLRFLLPVQVAAAVWIGRGIWVLWGVRTRSQHALLRPLPRVAAIFALAVMSLHLADGLVPLRQSPDFQRDDYRGLVQTITSELREGDAVILSAPGLSEIFGYYYRADAPVYPLPRSRDDAQTRADTQAIINQHDRIFALLYGTAEQDPNGVVEDTLKTAAYPISDEWFNEGDIRLLRYAAPDQMREPVTLDARFGDAITLESYALGRSEVLPGDAIQLQLNWRTDAPLDARYKVFVQLLDGNGLLVAQRDSEPGGGLELTTQWPADALIADQHALAVPDDLAPGTYTLIVGLYAYDPPNARLNVAGSDHLVLDQVLIGD